MPKKRILLIDDEKDFGGMVKISLEEKGNYEVRVESRGWEGIFAAREFRPDLILLDVIMPDMEGSFVASRIRDDQTLKDIPILFLTAIVSRDEASQGGQGLIGGFPFIAKPVGIQDLIDHIEKNIHPDSSN